MQNERKRHLYHLSASTGGVCVVWIPKIWSGWWKTAISKRSKHETIRAMRKWWQRHISTKRRRDSVWHTLTHTHTAHGERLESTSSSSSLSYVYMIAYPCYNIFTFLYYYFLLGRKSNASTPTVKPRLSKNICFYSLTFSFRSQLVLVVHLCTHTKRERKENNAWNVVCL